MEGVSSVIMTWRYLAVAGEAVRRALNERLTRDADCSLLEHDLLTWLSVAPDHRLRMLDLADHLGVTRGGLTRIVDRLVEREWIERERPENNRREVYAVLTPSGQRTLTAAREIYRQVLDDTLGAHLEERELAELERVTHKLLEAMQDDAGKLICRL